MPVSHKLKVIFVHIPKTGGSSIEKALGIYGKNNFGNNTQVVDDMLFGNGLQHLTMEEITDRLGIALVKQCFKFTMVRNPWERALSEWHWRRTAYPEIRKMSFKKFVAQELVDSKRYRHYWPQTRFVTGKDARGKTTNLVDYVGRFENLAGDFSHIASLCNLGATELPHVNRAEKMAKLFGFNCIMDGFRRGIRRGIDSSEKAYRYAYDDASRELIRQIYHADIETFGYEF